MFSHQFDALVLKSGSEVVRVPVQVTLSYDPEHDPVGVQMIVSQGDEGDVVWVLDRDLFVTGKDKYIPYGLGDVRVQGRGGSAAFARNMIMVCLRNPNGHADIGLPRKEIEFFLEETAEAAGAAGEHFEPLIDELIKEILTREQ